MDKTEALAALAGAVPDEESVYLPKPALKHVELGDIPAGVTVSIGEFKDDVMHVDWDGYFFVENGTLVAHCQYSMTRKYWDAPLGMFFYLDLVKRAIETREKQVKDVRFDSFEDEGAYIHLIFECLALPPNLDDAYREVLSRIAKFEEAAESVSQKAGIFAAETAQTVSGWGQQPLEQLVHSVETAKTTDDKGRSLEELIARLFASLPKMTVSGRVRTETEEIDITIVNDSDEPRLKREGAVILVECKNWSSKCGKNEFVIFKEKIINRKGRCTLGFLVSWNGFAETITKEMLRGSHESFLVVPMDGAQIRAAVREKDFQKALIGAWDKAITI